MLNKSTTQKFIWTTVTAVLILLIFINSMVPAVESSQMSGSVLSFFRRIFGEGTAMNDHLIRKFAHFAEYTLLGIFLIFTVRSYVDRIFQHIFIPLFVGLAVPVVDEFIQLFPAGRSSQVSDIALDFVGVITGMAFALILCYIRNRFFKRRWWR